MLTRLLSLFFVLSLLLGLTGANYSSVASPLMMMGVSGSGAATCVASAGTSTLLLHADGTNGSTTFTDSSASTHTITANGNAQVSTTSPKFGTGSQLSDGTGDYINTDVSADFNFGAGDFTVDFWIKSTMTTRLDVAGQFNNFASANWWGLLFNAVSSGDMALYEQSNSRISATSTGWNDGNWNHVALTRSGNSVRLFLNGTQVGSTFTTSFSYGSSSVGQLFDIQNEGLFDLNGNLDEIHEIKGTAAWTGNFTPNTLPYCG